MIQKGDKTEAAVAHRMTSLGYPVSKPFSDNLPYDFIVDIKGELYKVQVKTARERSDNPDSIVAELGRTRHSADGYYKDEYTEGEVDLFAIYWPGNQETYIFKFDEVGSRAVSICVGEVTQAHQQNPSEEYLLGARISEL